MINRIPAFMLASLQVLLVSSATALAAADTAEGPASTATEEFPSPVLAPSSMPPGQEWGGYGMPSAQQQEPGSYGMPPGQGAGGYGMPPGQGAGGYGVPPGQGMGAYGMPPGQGRGG